MSDFPSELPDELAMADDEPEPEPDDNRFGDDALPYDDVRVGDELLEPTTIEAWLAAAQPGSIAQP